MPYRSVTFRMLSGFGLCAVIAFTASAQERAPLEEIVVFAQKRAESAQDVPVSVTPMSMEQLDNAFVVDLTDLGFMAPNAQLQAVSTFPGFANFTMRGIGVSTSIRTLDPAVNIFVDGMVLGTQIGAVLDVFDVETVEVLRGPQGVFFGRNSTGGAVSLRTAKPTEDFNATAKLGIGSFGLTEFEGVVQGAMSDNGLRGKIAFQWREFDGGFEDRNGGSFAPATFNPDGVQPPNPTQDQTRQDSIFFKPTITFQPSDDFDFTLFGQYYKDEGGGSATQAFIDPRIGPQPATTLFGYTPPTDQFDINHDLLGVSETKSWHLIGEANWHLDNGTVTSVTALRDLSFDSSLDVDGTPFLLIHFPDNEEAADQFTQEVRNALDLNDRTDLIFGGFYMDSEMSVIERREFTGLTAGRAPDELNNIQSDWVQEQNSIAAFFNLRYELNPQWTLSGGLRYTREEKELNITPLTPCAGPGFSGCSTDKLFLEDSWNDVSPRLGVEYRPSDNAMWFASWTRGFRSGNFNARAGSAVTIGPADPEQADQFEIGLKGDYLDGTLRTNLAAFYTIYDDIQRVTNTQTATGQPLQLLRNAAKAAIPGLEAELTWSPTDALSLQASLGWVKPEFDEFTGLDVDSDGVVSAADRRAAEQLRFDRVPELTVFLGGEYRWTMNQLPGEFAYRLQWSWRDDFPTDVRNLETRFQDSYDLLDMSVRYENDNWRVALYGRNLTETNYVDIISTAFNQQAFGGQPRTYGLEVGYRF